MLIKSLKEIKRVDLLCLKTVGRYCKNNITRLKKKSNNVLNLDYYKYNDEFEHWRCDICSSEFLNIRKLLKNKIDFYRPSNLKNFKSKFSDFVMIYSGAILFCPVCKEVLYTSKTISAFESISNFYVYKDKNTERFLK